MGDIAEMVLEGILCEECGSFIDGCAAGYPRQCADCEAAKKNDLKGRKNFYEKRIRDAK
jgi:hypothetical protein